MDVGWTFKNKCWIVELTQEGPRPGLIEVLRCPECIGELTGIEALGAGVESLTCSECGLVLPVRNQVPFAFVEGDQPAFLSLDDEGPSKPNRAPSRHKGGAYHWETFGFGDLLPPELKGRALLHGCGDGGERRPLEELGFEVLAFDIYRTNATDFLGDAHRLPIATDSLDLVLSSQVLEHLDAPWTAAAEIARVLKPGGWFIGSVAFLKPFHKSYFHMSHEGVLKLLEPVGLKVDELRGGQSLFYSMYGGMVPGSRRLKRAAMGFVDDLVMGLRARAWSASRRTPSERPTDRFDHRFRFSFRGFDKLRYAPAVVFRAQKEALPKAAKSREWGRSRARSTRADNRGMFKHQNLG